MKNLKFLPVLLLAVTILFFASCQKEQENYNFTSDDFTWSIKGVSPDCDNQGKLYLEVQIKTLTTLEGEYEGVFYLTYESDCSGYIETITERSNAFSINQMVGEKTKVLTLESKPMDSNGNNSYSFRVTIEKK